MTSFELSTLNQFSALHEKPTFNAATLSSPTVE